MTDRQRQPRGTKKQAKGLFIEVEVEVGVEAHRDQGLSTGTAVVHPGTGKVSNPVKSPSCFPAPL